MGSSESSLATPSVVGSGSKCLGKSSHELGNAMQASADKMKLGSSQDCVRFSGKVLVSSGDVLGANSDNMSKALTDWAMSK